MATTLTVSDARPAGGHRRRSRPTRPARLRRSHPALRSALGWSCRSLGAVESVLFSPDNKLLATASDDNCAREWDLSTGSEGLRIAHTDHVYAVAFSGDERLLATGSPSISREAPTMSSPSLATILREHMTLSTACLDRLCLSRYVPTLQTPGQSTTFLRDHLGFPVPSSAVIRPFHDGFFV